MFEKIIKQVKNTVEETEQIDEQFYAQVVDEITAGYKDKGLVGKAIAQSNGNEAKFDSIYMKLRAKALQEEYIRKLNSSPTGNKIVEKQKAEYYHLSKEMKNYIAGLHSQKYFHKLFSVELENEGYETFFLDGLIDIKTLRKNGKKFKTDIDYDNMGFILIDKEGSIVNRFHFNFDGNRISKPE